MDTYIGKKYVEFVVMCVVCSILRHKIYTTLLFRLFRNLYTEFYRTKYSQNFE